MAAFLKFVTHDWYFAIPLFCMSLVAACLVIWVVATALADGPARGLASILDVARHDAALCTML